MNDSGMSLPEALVTVAVLGLLAAMALPGGTGHLARRRLELSSQLLGQGLERARAEAERRGEPCGLSLGAEGWEAPRSGELPPCLPQDGADGSSQQAAGPSLGGELVSSSGERMSLRHNFPEVLRVSAHGLVVDGGTAVLSAEGTDLRRCLVMAPPLGVVRLGRYGSDPANGLSSGSCLPDPTL